MAEREGTSEKPAKPPKGGDAKLRCYSAHKAPCRSSYRRGGSMRLPFERPPLALIACSDDWMSRALENVFQQHGYVVAHTRSGAQCLELARVATHDVLVLDESLSDLTTLAISRSIRESSRF